ncbi:MAG: 50S ribosomal protein L25 [Myxococcales bacterium]|nr:50S ribosomal protein L25 [Myxococcales bacterium]
MEAIALQSTTRDGRGKGPNRRLRAAGRVPAVVYGHGVETPLAVSLDPTELNAALANPKKQNALFDVSVDGERNVVVLVRDIQRDAVSRAIEHVDLVAPDLNRPVVAVVPLEFTGRSIGVQTGGRLRTPYREVKLRSVPALVPAAVVIDVTQMDQGDTLMSSQLPLPEGVEVVAERDFVVAKVLKPRGVKKVAAKEEKKKKK